MLSDIPKRYNHVFTFHLPFYYLFNFILLFIKSIILFIKLVLFGEHFTIQCLEKSHEKLKKL